MKDDVSEFLQYKAMKRLGLFRTSQAGGSIVHDPIKGRLQFLVPVWRGLRPDSGVYWLEALCLMGVLGFPESLK